MSGAAGPPRIALVGAGGLGGPIALALAAAGAELVIFDGDLVEPSNLHRQLHFGLGDVGRPKASTLAARLGRGRGPAARGVDRRWIADEAERSCAGCAAIVDGSDDPVTKFAVADWATRRGLPSVIAGALGLGGNVFAGAPGRACFRCLFEEPPDEAPSCADAGVLGPVVASVAGLAALLMLELLAGRAEAGGAIWIVDDALGAGASAAPRRVAVMPRPGCPACAAGVQRGAREARSAGDAPAQEVTWPRS
jgi:adenylyltransferase/sulfurtransferase